jgi:gamma-glutamyltranspeptidase/glutathione hydrolase
MAAALTLTHGEGFGARVTVEGLGLVLGHGMSRFDPQPRHPNAPGPRKHPLTNMCPTVLLRDGRPYVAIGGAGGRRIVNSVLGVLALLVGHDLPLDAALNAPRLHTEGDLTVTLDPKTPGPQQAYLKDAGYTVKHGGGANVSAVRVEPAA